LARLLARSLFFFFPPFWRSLTQGGSSCASVFAQPSRLVASFARLVVTRFCVMASLRLVLAAALLVACEGTISFSGPVGVVESAGSATLLVVRTSATATETVNYNTVSTSSATPSSGSGELKRCALCVCVGVRASQTARFLCLFFFFCFVCCG
jgi:hypothetical protein